MTSSEELGELMVTAYNYQKQGQYSSAIQSWNVLVNSKSADNGLKANAHINLGHLHQQQGNFDLAHESMASAIKANPNSADAYYCLAYMEQQKENFNKAIEYFECALKLNKKDTGIFNNLANCYDRLNKTKEAI